MFPRPPVVAVVCCLLLATPVAVGFVGAQSSSNGSNASTDGTEPTSGTADRCFPDDGYEFTIGTEGPEISMVLHLSLLTNLGSPGVFGVELSGSVGGPPVIQLQTGVHFGGIESVGGFLNNPFGPFSIVFDYQFDLLSFGIDLDHRDTDAPIDGPVGDAAC